MKLITMLPTVIGDPSGSPCIRSLPHSHYPKQRINYADANSSFLIPFPTLIRRSSERSSISRKQVGHDLRPSQPLTSYTIINSALSVIVLIPTFGLTGVPPGRLRCLDSWPTYWDLASCLQLVARLAIIIVGNRIRLRIRKQKKSRKRRRSSKEDIWVKAHAFT